MYALANEQYQAEVEPIFRQVFSGDNLDQPFSSNITVKQILYPIGLFPDKLLLEALTEAATTIGDTGCYLDNCLRSLDSPNYAYIPLCELLEGYYAEDKNKLIGYRLGVDLVLEYIIFSATGKWGLMVAHEYYGLLGGPQEFMQTVQLKLPGIDRQVYKFLDSYKQEKEQRIREGRASMTLKWLPTLLSHVYGVEIGERMLQESGLP